MRDLDKFRGCLLAGAAGDALGYEVEFMSEKEIFTHFGENRRKRNNRACRKRRKNTKYRWS